VSESDIGAVKQGDAADFTLEAFPGRTFHGRVVQVRQAPQVVQNVVTYDAVVSVANPRFLLKPGMTATVGIVSARRQDVLRIPDQALRFSPGGLASARDAGGSGSAPPHASDHRPPVSRRRSRCFVSRNRWPRRSLLAAPACTYRTRPARAAVSGA
jgi:multidrug efflux pump subunit AcrA (membrane-fusion protein)